MKPFNLEEYLANPNKKIVTRDGRKVTRVLCTDAKGPYPVAVLVESFDGISAIAKSYTSDGQYYVNGESPSDLFFVTEKREGWINIFRGKDGPLTGNIVFASKEDAEETRWHGNSFTHGTYLESVKVEWEE